MAEHIWIFDPHTGVEHKPKDRGQTAVKIMPGSPGDTTGPGRTGLSWAWPCTVTSTQMSRYTNVFRLYDGHLPRPQNPGLHTKINSQQGVCKVSGEPSNWLP